MKALTKENILFIDNYLRNSGVDFIDVRIEMVDHVASEIEMRINNDDTKVFYDVFKTYMIENKSKLLKNSKKYKWITDRRILKKLFKKLFSFQGCLVFIIILFAFNLFEKFVNKEQMVFVMRNASPITLLLVSVLYGFVIRTKKERYSSTERIGLFFFLTYYVFNFLFRLNFTSKTEMINNYLLLKTGTMMFVFILVILTILAFEFKKAYQLKYEGVE